MSIHRCCSAFWGVLLLYACSTDTLPPAETRPIAQDPEGVRLVNQGAFFLKQGQPRKALTVLHQAAKRVPQLPSVHFNTGLAHVRLGEYGLSIPPLQRAVELDSLNGSFRFVLGDALSAEHRYPEAILQYRRAIELEPEKAPYHYQLGKSLRATADFDGAIAAFEAALDLEPDFVDALYHRSELLGRSDRLAEAEAGYKKLLVLAPQHVAALVALATLQTQAGKHREAISTIEQAIAWEPRHAQAHYLHHQILNRMGRADGTAKALQIYQRLSTAKRHYDQGQIYLLKSKREQAITSFSQAIEIDSSFVDAYLSLCIVHLQANDSQRARHLLERILSVETEHAEAHSLLGETHLLERDFAAAQQSFVEAMALDSTSVRAAFGLGRSSLLSKDYQQADVALRRTLEWAPTHLPIYVEAHYALALTQIQLKNYEEAKTLLEKVLELNPDYPQAETKLAWLEASF